jgi:hypothetical protein
MSAHTTKRLLLVGVTAEVVYRTMVRQHVRAYLGIEQGHRHSPRLELEQYNLRPVNDTWSEGTDRADHHRQPTDAGVMSLTVSRATP